ncbi:MAG: leucyl aminopeptidase, partial [Alphaproteobacteria bacterium]
ELLAERDHTLIGLQPLEGLGQGSVRESQLVVMQWKGAKDKGAAPVAFIGKGVTFDTGGISIKPAAGMDAMKYDMGGAGTVTGLMHVLAGRKARVNAIGVIGLVENMPDGNAQRPGDIVKSMSGQTVEILNTDAEGRLVLADALWYTQGRFKPKFMVDLATLTGAIRISLGLEIAGLFSNNDELAERLLAAGKAEGEELWRMPLNDRFDKMIDSPVADMKNIGGQFGGSITAAAFLQRFENKVPWAHLDIAGTAWAEEARGVTPKGASGYGVRLLNRLVADHYEG